MAVEITKETTKYTWETNSYTFGEFTKPWNEAEIANVTADVTELTILEDSHEAYMGVSLKDNLAVSEGSKREINSFTNEPISFVELLTKDIFMYQKRTMALMEGSWHSYSWMGNEEFVMSDAQQKKVTIEQFEELGVADTYWDYINYLLAIVESISLKETKRVSVTHSLTDNFSISDETKKHLLAVANEVLNVLETLQKATMTLLNDEISLADRITRSSKVTLQDSITFRDDLLRAAVYYRELKEAVSIASGENNSCDKEIAEAVLSIKENETKSSAKVVNEAIAFAEFFKKYIPIICKFYETIGIAELDSNHYKAIKKEELWLTDGLIRACEAVLSDLHITNSPMSFEEFLQALQTPTMYHPFIEFKVGEYEYKDALVRVLLSTTTRETFPSLTSCTLHVDIPDTDDRGTVDIVDTTAATKVYFNKFYYNPPEVIVVLKGGNTADGAMTPNVVSTEYSDEEGRYFEVELLDSYGNRKTGSISWASKGY